MRSTKFQKTWIVAQALVLSVSLCAQQTPLPGQAPPPIAQASAAGQEQSKTVLFEGTAVHLRLTKELSSATAQVGDAVTFDTTEDVRLGDAIAIPKGSHALGKVTTVVPKRRMGRAGKLDLSIEYVRLPSGEKLSLSGSPAKTGGGHLRDGDRGGGGDGGDWYRGLACSPSLPPHARKGHHNPSRPGGHSVHG